MAENVLIAVRFPLPLIGAAPVGKYLFAGSAFVSRGSVPVCAITAMSAGNLLTRLAVELTGFIGADGPVRFKVGANAEQLFSDGQIAVQREYLKAKVTQEAGLVLSRRH